MTNLLNKFLELIQIDSPSGSELEVRKYIKSELESLNIKSSTDSSGNLFARVNGVGDPVLLCAHMDTVEPGRGIKPQVTGDLIKSSGSTILGSDNKAAIACILEALKNSLKSKKRALELLFTVREETDGGISGFDFKKIKSKTALIADGGDTIGNIIIASPFICEFKIKIIGKAAHAAWPEKGINALTVASRAISKVKVGRVNKNTTVNLGLIIGGHATNTVPGEVNVSGEVRSFDKKYINIYAKKTEEIFAKFSKTFGTRYVITKKMYSDGYKLSKQDTLVADISDTMKSLSITPLYKTMFGASDANQLVAHGINTVNIGYGGKDVHTTNESIKITDLEKLAGIIQNYITV